jgi:putative addiction module component (TIGR02574 family)
MSVSFVEVLEPAKKLQPRDRARLAIELIASLDGRADTDAEKAWATEIRRRAAEARKDPSVLVDWAEAKLELRKAVGSARR